MSTPNYYETDAQSFKDLEHEAEEVNKLELTDARAVNKLRHLLRMGELLRMEAKTRVTISSLHSDEEGERKYSRLLDRIDTFMHVIKVRLDTRMTVIQSCMDGSVLP